MDKEKILVPQVVENVTRVMWSDQPVLTTAQLAEFYETSVDNIKMNFNRNADRFVEGKHFFRLEGDELSRFKDYVTESYLVQKNARHVYLWTKRGAARHAKMLNTDRAWDVFEALEDNYFDRPEIKQPDLLAPFADFVALEREKFIVANSEETKNFAKAQLLRELASASGDNQSLRNDLIRHAAKILIDEV